MSSFLALVLAFNFDISAFHSKFQSIAKKIKKYLLKPLAVSADNIIPFLREIEKFQARVNAKLFWFIVKNKHDLFYYSFYVYITTIFPKSTVFQLRKVQNIIDIKVKQLRGTKLNSLTLFLLN